MKKIRRLFCNCAPFLGMGKDGRKRRVRRNQVEPVQNDDGGKKDNNPRKEFNVHGHFGFTPTSNKDFILVKRRGRK